jgi:hypothetical protein
MCWRGWLSAVLAATLVGCGGTPMVNAGGGGSGAAGPESGGTGRGGGASSAALAFGRTTTSTTYRACELSTDRVITFDLAPGAPGDGFACESADGSRTDVHTTVHLDFTTTGATPFGTVKLPASGKVAEVWVLAKARVDKHGKVHPAHGRLSCVAAEGHRYVVLRFVPSSTIDLSASSAGRLAAVIDPRRLIGERGDCDVSCDDDDEHSEREAESDARHGSISLESQSSLEKGE